MREMPLGFLVAASSFRAHMVYRVTFIISPYPPHLGLVFRFLIRAFSVPALKGNSAMNLRPVLALSVWLVAGTVQPTSAQLPLRHDPAAQACAAPAGAGVSGTPEGHAILATVKRVDPGQGQLEFTTETGSFVLTTTPAEIHDLRVGDQLLICLHEEGSDGIESFAEDGSAASGVP